MQFALAAGCGEEVQALSTEDLRQGPDGEQEAVARRGEPPLPVRAQAAVGDDAVDMDVLPEVLAPGVQHHRDADLAAEPARVASELQQGPGRSLEEQPVDEAGLRLRERVEFVRQREHHVPVADVEQAGGLPLHPPGLLERLALGAVPVPA